MLRKVYLEGEIADRFGSEFEMEVNSFADVMSCLNAIAYFDTKYIPILF